MHQYLVKQVLKEWVLSNIQAHRAQSQESGAASPGAEYKALHSLSHLKKKQAQKSVPGKVGEKGADEASRWRAE